MNKLLNRKTKNLKNRNPQHVFIDESGTLPDPADKFIVVAAVGMENNRDAKILISRTLKSLRQKKAKIKEIKSYYSGDRTKIQVLSGTVAAEFEIFAIITDKKGRKISDTPENFALLVGELINEINLWQSQRKLKITIDRHFSRKEDEKTFNEFLKKRVKSLNYSIQHAESQRNLEINFADFAASAVLTKYNKNNCRFYNIIKDGILVKKIVNWPELKRKSLLNKKFPEPAQAPIQGNLA
jgi:hypothetical protein